VIIKGFNSWTCGAEETFKVAYLLTEEVVDLTKHRGNFVKIPRRRW